MRNNRAFTLIELAVALGVMALLMFLLSSVFQHYFSQSGNTLAKIETEITMSDLDSLVRDSQSLESSARVNPMLDICLNGTAGSVLCKKNESSSALSGTCNSTAFSFSPPANYYAYTMYTPGVSRSGTAPLIPRAVAGFDPGGCPIRYTKNGVLCASSRSDTECPIWAQTFFRPVCTGESKTTGTKSCRRARTFMVKLKLVPSPGIDPQSEIAGQVSLLTGKETFYEMPTPWAPPRVSESYRTAIAGTEVWAVERYGDGSTKYGNVTYYDIQSGRKVVWKLPPGKVGLMTGARTYVTSRGLVYSGMALTNTFWTVSSPYSLYFLDRADVDTPPAGGEYLQKIIFEVSQPQTSALPGPSENFIFKYGLPYGSDGKTFPNPVFDPDAGSEQESRICPVAFYLNNTEYLGFGYTSAHINNPTTEVVRNLAFCSAPLSELLDPAPNNTRNMRCQEFPINIPAGAIGKESYGWGYNCGIDQVNRVYWGSWNAFYGAKRIMMHGLRIVDDGTGKPDYVLIDPTGSNSPYHTACPNNGAQPFVASFGGSLSSTPPYVSCPKLFFSDIGYPPGCSCPTACNPATELNCCTSCPITYPGGTNVYHPVNGGYGITFDHLGRVHSDRGPLMHHWTMNPDFSSAGHLSVSFERQTGVLFQSSENRLYWTKRPLTEEVDNGFFNNPANWTSKSIEEIKATLAVADRPTGVLAALSSLNNGSIVGLERWEKGHAYLITPKLNSTSGLYDDISVSKLFDVGLDCAGAGCFKGERYMYNDFTGATLPTAPPSHTLDLTNKLRSYIPGIPGTKFFVRWVDITGAFDVPWAGYEMKIKCYKKNLDGTDPDPSADEDFDPMPPSGKEVLLYDSAHPSKRPSCNPNSAFNMIKWKPEIDPATGTTATFSKTRAIEFRVEQPLE